MEPLTLYPSSAFPYDFLLSLALKMANEDPESLFKRENMNWLKIPKIAQVIFGKDPLLIRNDSFYQTSLEIASVALRANPFSFCWLSNDLRSHPDILAIKEETERSFSSRMPSSALIEKHFFCVSNHKRMDNFSSSYTDQLKNDFLLLDGSHSIASKIRFVKLEYYQQSFQTNRFTDSIYIRDSAVTLSNGTLLIPRPLKDPMDGRKIEYFFPPYMKKLFLREHLKCKNLTSFLGRGLEAGSANQAKILCFDHQIPFKEAETSIEGGNIFIFDSNGQRKAIIGELSLFLSISNLKEPIMLGVEIPEITEEAYRLARNASFWEEDKEKNFHTLPFQEKKTVFDRIFLEITDEEKERFKEDATLWQKKLELAKQKIASDIEVPLEHIVFLPQTGFHIDLELTVTPGGEVLVHDDALMIKELLNLKKQNEEAYFLVTKEKTKEEYGEELLLKEEEEENKGFPKNFSQSCYDEAYKSYVCHKTIRKKQYSLLQAHHIPFKQVAGDLKTGSSERCRLNYMNGIFIPIEHTNRFYYLTNGLSKQEELDLYITFSELFKDTIGASAEVLFMPNFSKFCGPASAGIRCLTLEV